MDTDGAAARRVPRCRVGRAGRAGLAVAAVVAALGASACGSGTGSGGGAADGAAVTVVASTRVWQDIAAAVGGDTATTTTIIPAGADPHEFEAAAGDVLTVADADIVVMNGGGYDDFVAGLVRSAGGGAQIIDAYALHGDAGHGGAAGSDGHAAHDHGAGERGVNEHVWFDFDTVGAAADALAEGMAERDPDHAAGYRSRAAALRARLAELGEQADAIAAQAPAPVLSTEPVAHYLLERAGVEDLTPPGFGEAMEHGSDPAPADIARMRELLAQGTVAALVYNTQADGPAARAVRQDAEAAGVPVVEVAETPPGGIGYTDWVSGILDRLGMAVTA
ncbi:metal ABC transporter solute-binding protein, Zn/Mn family [Tomitella gaofuii]|uniref:metal ABC transporter solute-binding protein, Zn/Mn family n=1 Tax=Tomitella gaofuii TaxID=2760083 RepID=UPI0020BF86D5|nr:zinc ABC transporter substrate-binding protein [Tomitella gaofuii]